MPSVKLKTETKIMQKITKNTNVKIQVDEDTIIDKPVIEVLSGLIDMENKIMRNVNCRFTAGKTIVEREIGDVPYGNAELNTTMLDTFIIQWILDNTIVE